jgi:glutathione peroxidase
MDEANTDPYADGQGSSCRGINLLNAYQFALPALKSGETIDLARYAGRPIVVANTASLCGFTSQYAGLQALWTRYAARGLVVLAVPSPDFGGQEHSDPAKTAAVCDARFNITFPVAASAHVKGPDATPLFRWLAAEAGVVGQPRWNFYKYVIGRDGRLVQWFSSFARPDGSRVRAVVERCLHPS